MIYYINILRISDICLIISMEAIDLDNLDYNEVINVSKMKKGAAIVRPHGHFTGTALLWAARIIGLLASCFFLFFFIGESLSDIMTGGFTWDWHLLLFLPLLLAGIAGYCAALLHKACGPILLLIGGAGMMAYLLLLGGWGDIGAALIYGLPYLFCAVCFWAAWRLGGRAAARA